MEIVDKLHVISDAVLKSKIGKALSLLSRLFTLYPFEQIALSFNGGKDSTVLLHLLRAALEQQSADGGLIASQRGVQPGVQAVSRGFDGGSGLMGIRSFYFDKEDDFDQVRDFVKDVNIKYKLDISFLPDGDFKQGLESYIHDTNIKAIVLGTRRGDPNAGEQEFFCPSSKSWPAFMRVNPILDWTYHDVWAFLRAMGLDYCTLYDQGYTSLGSRHNTLPNSALKAENGCFHPAHSLADGRLERAGRLTRLTSTDSGKLAGDLPAALTPAVGIVVIGDELLSGKVTDQNTPFLCQQLRALGWQVRRVVVVPDDVTDIAAEVASASASFHVVLTSGGVGPTLDDVTMQGVARAIGKPLARHPEFEERLTRVFGSSLTSAHLRMADLPDDDALQLVDFELQDGTPSYFPLVRVRNVFVLPGVPHLLRQRWGAVRRCLEELLHAAPFHNRVLRLASADEAQLAPALDAVAEQFGGDVAIGSYPVTGQSDGALVLLTLESKDSAHLDEATAALRALLPPGALLSEQCDVVSLVTRKRTSLSLERPPRPPDREDSPTVDAKP